MAGPRHQDGGCVLLLVVVVVTCVAVTLTHGAPAPHILVILADDFGWNDVGFRNPAMDTPNIDRLAREGVNLTQSYMQPMCTPSRAAFLSGVYPYKLGLQHSVFKALKNNSLPVDLTLLPQSLQQLGYATHYVGKWHLGFCHPSMTPTRRGFHSFYGMYNGKATFYTHLGKWGGYDMHHDNATDGYNIDWGARGRYSTHMFTEKAIEVLDRHQPASQPLFLVLSYQAVHGPLQVPPRYVDNFCSQVTTGEDRKLHCAMGAAMDEGIGNVTSALDRLGYSDNLITLFIADNGGSVKLAGSNWPLRGSKITLWEGATRVTTVLHSNTLLPLAPYHWQGIMHATDWYPTLMRAAGYEGSIPGIDGVDQWQAISSNGPSRRQELVYNINEVRGQAAIRVGRYKLIQGKGATQVAGWYNPPPGVPERPAPPRLYPPYSLYDLQADPTETFNLIDDPDLQQEVSEMKVKLEGYRAGLKVTPRAVSVTQGKPSKHGGAWVTGWCQV